MKKAILYTRVSTEEQEDGASLRYQEEQLRQYCTKKNIEVLALYTDNESGRTFDRKAFKELLDYVSKNTSQIDYILVTRSDRFARNLLLMAEAKEKFRKLGIKIKAIEQDIDETIPEYKLIESIQYALDEIESDKISIRVKASNYKFAKEGAFLNRAPKGYNKTRIDGRSTLIPNDFAQLIREAFTLFSGGQYSTEALRKKLAMKTVCKQGFINILRNKTYAGFVTVPAFKGDAAYWTKGLHEPIIDIALFDKVQSVLSGKRPVPIRASEKGNKFYLRGHVMCPLCNHPFTASRSKGRNEYYEYYHCDSKYGCNQRFTRSEFEGGILQLIGKFEVKRGLEKIYQGILQNAIGDNTRYTTKRINALQAKLDELVKKLHKAQDLLIDGSISDITFNSINNRHIAEQRNLETELKQLQAKPDGNSIAAFDKGLTVVKSLKKLMISASNEDKSLIIGSIFPEKLYFQKGQYRTANINGFILLLCPAINDLGLLEKEKAIISDGLSSNAPPLGLEPISPKKLRALVYHLELVGLKMNLL